MSNHSVSALKSKILVKRHSIATKIPKLSAIKASLWGLYVLLVAAILPITKLGEQALMRWDYSHHYSQIAELHEIMKIQGTSWGYSDLFQAGYPIGISSNLGSKGWTWFVHLLSNFSIDTVLAFNLFAVLWLVLPPLLLYQGCRWFHLSPSQATAATIIATIYTWTSTLFWFLRYGVVSFVASAFLAMFTISALYAYSQKGRWYHAVVFCLGSALCGWVHPLSAVFIIIGSAIVYLARFRQFSLAQHGTLLLLGSMVLVLQWPWLGPYVQLRHWFVRTSGHMLHLQPQGVGSMGTEALSSPATMLPAGLACVGAILVSVYLWRHDRKLSLLLVGITMTLFLVGFVVETPLHRLLLVGWVVGIYAWWHQRRLTLILLFTLLPAALLFLGYMGRSFAELQPARNIPVAYLWLTIPTAVAGEWLLRAMRNAPRRFILPVGALLLLLSIWPVIYPPHATILAQESLQFIQPPSPEAERLVDWLETNTTREGRILFEDSLYWLKDHSVSAGYLAYKSQRAFIGGPYPWGGPVDYVAGYPFDNSIDTMTSSQMAERFALYNIHWVIVHSEASREFFDTHSDLVEPVEELSLARIYRVKNQSNFFLKGSGQVAFQDHQIELWDLHGPEVVLKYHWVPKLESEPVHTIEREMIAPDPHGFIKITNPPERLTIRVAP
jgi:hypothetical protein